MTSSDKQPHTDSGEEMEPSLSHSFIEEHLPVPEEVLFTLGHYQVLKNIATGGMGEVFLAYDTLCGRRIALKRIRQDLVNLKKINNRFLKEAHITSQLTHPSIIPIYSIHKEGNSVYYTMPYVQGETLKEILREARRQEKAGNEWARGSIPSLSRLFLNICQAVAYAHSKGILHRDLKPENIIVGQYGEVLILDWGLAKRTDDHHSPAPRTDLEEEPQEQEGFFSGLTLAGKVVGTVNFMAPERALGKASTYQTDIYSLGVILYQILTLKYPFKRTSLKEFRKNLEKEALHDPVLIAPYRDIPRLLSRICTRCLEKEPSERYQSVDDLIYDIENYLEGRAEWFKIAELNPSNKGDWEFQENVYLAEHVAITRASEASEWLNLMISKGSFGENIRIEARVRFGNQSNGLGFLLNVPEAGERRQLNDGYCLWLGSDINPSTKLLRAAVEVIHTPEIALERERWYTVRIDKIDTHIHVYIDGQLQFSYISHLPLVGTHVGLLARDTDYQVADFFIHIAGQNVMVKCLAVPDAFLANKQYDAALSEYRRIGYSFPGRAEGREALFRAGITLLEKARTTTNSRERQRLLDEALNEFELLHLTPGAPLEYLGKALVYQELHEDEEEVKCFELAYRRYPHHPLLTILQEQIAYRLHESSRTSRRGAYQFVLLTVRHLSNVTVANHVQKLLARLQKHWEPLPFIENHPSPLGKEGIPSADHCAIVTAFWLGRPFIIEEIIDDLAKQSPLPTVDLGNALFSLIKLGYWQLAREKMEQLNISFPQIATVVAFEEKGDASDLEELLASWNSPLEFGEERLLIHLMTLMLRRGDYALAHKIGGYAAATPLCSELCRQSIDELDIWGYLLESRWDEAGERLSKYPISRLNHDDSLLHILYGCWLLVTEGEEIAKIHFSGALEMPYPRTFALLSHYLTGKIDEKSRWFQRSFLWEKRQLYKQLQLYYHCCHEEKKALFYNEKFTETFRNN